MSKAQLNRARQFSQAIVAAAERRGVRVEALAAHRFEDRGAPPALLLGYGSLSEPAIRRGIAELAAAVDEAAAR